jgi:protein-S-isoprenylcysteine O-methyltransferase Ste14
MRIWTDTFVTMLSLGVVLAYVWSVKGHFASPKTPAGAWVISVMVSASTLLLLWLTWSNDQPAAATVAGLAIELASIWLFIAAVLASRESKLRFAFDPQHPHGLIQNGPYRFVRHPFYVSYLLFWAGWSVATWSVMAIPVPPIFLVLYWLAARMEERNFVASSFSATYGEYRSRVGFFFPRRLL